MQKIFLNRLEDVTGFSGTGIVWSGYKFNNGWLIGEWVTNNYASSRVFYPNVVALAEIHGHDGRTKVIEEDSTENCFQLVAHPDDTIDGNPFVAEGAVLPSGSAVCCYYAKYTSLATYDKLADLTGMLTRSQLVVFKQPPPPGVYLREKVFK
jgi:hypothetical protein